MTTPQLEFGKRLCLAIERSGYQAKPAVVAREFNLLHGGNGVSLHGARRWLKGEVIPTFDKVETLASWLRVSIHHLLYGLEQIPYSELALKSLEQAGAHERFTIEKFLALPAEQRKTVSAVIEAFAFAQAQAAA